MYGADTGGAEVPGTGWNFDISEVMTEDGVFNVELDVSMLDFILPASDNYWLEIQVDGDTSMVPRQRLISVPFAITSRNLIGGYVAAHSTVAAAPSIIGANLSGGDAIWATSSTGRGVYSLTNSVGQSAIQGTNNSSGPGVRGESKIGAGVFGSSDTTVGVWGQNTFSDDNLIKLPVIANPAVAGDFLPVGAVAGKSTRGYAGVSGLSGKGWGVYGSTGRTEDGGAGGVGGLSAGPGPGIWGLTLYAGNGPGVRGSYSSVDVFGELGTKRRPAHLTADRKMGVYGQARGADYGYGVYGESETGKGVYAVSYRGNALWAIKPDQHSHSDDSPNTSIGSAAYILNKAAGGGSGIYVKSDHGDGIKTYAGDSDDAAVDATAINSTSVAIKAHHGSGIALDVDGRLRIKRNSWFTWVGGTPSGWIGHRWRMDYTADSGAACGYIRASLAIYKKGCFRVYHSNVNLESIILITECNTTRSLNPILHKHDGYFDIYIDRPPATVFYYQIQYLIISP